MRTAVGLVSVVLVLFAVAYGVRGIRDRVDSSAGDRSIMQGLAESLDPRSDLQDALRRKPVTFLDIFVFPQWANPYLLVILLVLWLFYRIYRRQRLVNRLEGRPRSRTPTRGRGRSPSRRHARLASQRG